MAVASETAPPVRRVGRPPRIAERRDQIVSAFIALVAERGLERTKISDVAAAADIQATAIRHFIGNREQLVVAAVEEINRRYRQSDYSQVSKIPDIATLIMMYFNPPAQAGVNARAFAALEPEAERNPATRAQVRESYRIFVDLIAGVLRRSYPDASEDRVRAAAYSIECLSEMNARLQRLGFAEEYGTGAAQAALVIAEGLADS